MSLSKPRKPKSPTSFCFGTTLVQYADSPAKAKQIIDFFAECAVDEMKNKHAPKKFAIMLSCVPAVKKGTAT